MKSRTIVCCVLPAALVLAACAKKQPEPAEVPVDPAISNCLAPATAETGVSAVTPLGTTPTKLGTQVMVEVSGADAPWACVIGADGLTVQSVYYTGKSG